MENLKKNRPYSPNLLAEIEKIQGVPNLLHYWFKHDNWTTREGLMLLTGLSPDTSLGTERDLFGEIIDTHVFIETLDGFEQDPNEYRSYDAAFTRYENLWESGYHRNRCTPAYFIDWAQSKDLSPSWLQWAIDNRYYSPDLDKVTAEKEISGKSETSYLNIIGALCDLYWRQKHLDDSKINQAEIIYALEKYQDYAGLSERNLKDKLSKAIKAIRSP